VLVACGPGRAEERERGAVPESPSPSPLSSPVAGDVAVTAVRLRVDQPRETLRRDSQLGPAERKMMTEVSLDELGPVDYVVVELPAGASNFTGAMAAELRALVGSRTIRVIDVLILTGGQDRGRSRRRHPPPGGQSANLASSASPTGAATSSGPEGILHPDAVVLLFRVEILREQRLAAQAGRTTDDHCVPERNVIPAVAVYRV